MTQSGEFIILWTTKVGEKSLVLHTLSRGWGRRSFITSVGKGTSMALYQPLSIINAEFSENAKSELWRMKGVCSVFPLNGLRTDMKKNSISLFMSEVLYRVLRDGSFEDGLYEWCRGCILTLDALQEDFSNFHLRFLMEFASALGFSPSAESLAPFAGEAFHEVADLLRLSLADFLVYPLSGARRSRIADVLLAYISSHAEINLNVRSLGVLKELWN